jgi:hypothetical protein
MNVALGVFLTPLLLKKKKKRGRLCPVAPLIEIKYKIKID